MDHSFLHRSFSLLLKILPYCYWIVVLLALVQGYVYAGPSGTDYLSGADTAIAGTFGDNTTFEHVLYVVEACAGAIAYIKTKSYMVLIGLPVLMIVTHFFFKMVAPAS